jgi:hypothetical protein
MDMGFLHKKKFDSIEIKRSAQAKIYEAIKGKTPEAEIAYFRRSVDKSKFSKWWQSASSHTELSEPR